MLGTYSNRISIKILKKYFVNQQIRQFTNKDKKLVRDQKNDAKEHKTQKAEEENKYNFEKRDEAEMFEYDKRIYYDKTYLRIMGDWKDNLDKKRRAKAIIKERFEHYVNFLIFYKFSLYLLRLRKNSLCMM